MVRASSINVDFSLIFGLALANGLIALSGALISHYLGLSDQSFSNGTLIYGLAAVIIGEAIFGKRNVALGLTSAVVGSVIYKIIVAFVIDVSLFRQNSRNLMKLTCAIIVAATLIVPEIKHKIENAKAKKEARKNCLKLKMSPKPLQKITVNEHKALNNINLTLNDGEFVTIVGSNGAGKINTFSI